MTQPFQIAIDGTVAAGKGTVSKLLAERLGFLYIDTGAMYRCVAYLSIEHNIDAQNSTALLAELKKHHIDLRMPAGEERDGRLVTVLLDGEDVSWKIRTEQVSSLASVVAQHQTIRAELVNRQQKLAERDNVVMEGRDITHTVLPNAQLKIYLDAKAEVRAKRRWNELKARGVDATYASVLAELQKRDELDKQQNLKKMAGVWEINTTDLTIDEVIVLIYNRTEQLMTAAVE